MSELFDLAYKREKAAARQLARATGLSPEAALQQILQASAGSGTIEELTALRREERARVTKRVADRRQQAANRRAAKSRAQAPDSSSWLAWFDGAVHPNPGRMGIGGVLTCPSGATTEISFHAGDGDSSEAEYRALIAVLQAAIAARADKLVVHGDSRVVIDDVQATIGSAALTPWRLDAQTLLAQLADVTLRWIPRARNQAADALSQRAVRRHTAIDTTGTTGICLAAPGETQ